MPPVSIASPVPIRTVWLGLAMHTYAYVCELASSSLHTARGAMAAVARSACNCWPAHPLLGCCCLFFVLVVVVCAGCIFITARHTGCE